MSTGAHSRLTRHLAFWAGTVVLSFLMQLPAHLIAGVPLYAGGILFVQLPASLLLVYPLLYGIVPRLLRGQLTLGLLLLLVWVPASIVAVNVLRGLYDLGPGPAWFGEPVVKQFRWSRYSGLSFAWFVLLATAGAASTAKLLSGWLAQQKQSQALRQRQAQAELQLLKAQLQPTFLFDTLHVLRQLTAEKAPAAPGAVLHLSALLRYLLYESTQTDVPLADEVDMLRHYVALEQLRLGPRTEVSVSFSGETEGYRVAPLLLLPLLENAFRHGTGPALECPWISIDLVARKNLLIFKLINSWGEAAAGWREGHGLHTIRQRLARLYPGRHALKILTDADTFLVVLELQPNPLPAPSALAAVPPSHWAAHPASVLPSGG